MIVRRRAHEAFKFQEMKMIQQFCHNAQEYMLLVYPLVPTNHIVHFYYVGSTPFAFLWTALQPSERGGTILRVHALFILKWISKRLSKQITKHFENILTLMAKNAEAHEIGFYTRRNPHAFCRRLNRTAPHPWMLDSYVCVRRV